MAREHRPTLVGLAACLLIAAGASAQEITLQNDSYVIGGSANVQIGFVNGEIGASTFFPDASLFPLRVLRVQIAWSSFLPGAMNNVQDSIVLYRGIPGQPGFSLLLETDPPQLTPQFINEFDVSNENIVITDHVAITAGLKFSDAPNGSPLKASLITDLNGCQAGRNWVFAIPGGWQQLCSFGATGDFVIRLVVEKEQTCYPDCDQSGTLNVFDYICFGNAYSAQQTYADCDQSGSFNVFDYICFGNSYAAGCP